MALITRALNGGPLTIEQMDNNLLYLENIAIGGGTGSGGSGATGPQGPTGSQGPIGPTGSLSIISGTFGSIPMLNETLNGYTASVLIQDSNEIVSNLKIKAEEGLRFGNIESGTTQGTFEFFGLPTSLADFVVDSQGNMFMASDSSNDSYAIYKITPAGIVSTIGFSQYQASYVTINNEDTLFFVNQSGSVTRVKANGDIVVMPFSNGGIKGIIANNTGDAFVLNYGIGDILKFAADNTVSTFFSVPDDLFPYIYDFKLASDGSIITCNNGMHNSWKIAPDGSTFSNFGGAIQYQPQALVISPNDGSVYITVSSGTSQTNNEPCIYKITADGATTSVYALHDFNFGNNRYDMVIDSNDVIYLATTNINYIWKFVPGQNPVKVTTTSTNPSRLFIDGDDNLYVLNLAPTKSITAFLPMPVNKYLSVDSDGNVVDLDDVVTTGTDIIMNKNVKLKVSGENLGISIANAPLTKKSKKIYKLPSITSGSTSFETIRIDIYDNVWSYNVYTGYLYKNDSDTYLYMPSVAGGRITTYCAGSDGFMYVVLHDNTNNLVITLVKIAQDMSYEILPNTGIADYYGQFIFPALVVYREQTNELLIQGPSSNLIIYSIETNDFILVNNPSGGVFQYDLGNEAVSDIYGNIYYFGPSVGYLIQIKTDNTINVLNYGTSISTSSSAFFDKNNNNIYYSDGRLISGCDITDPNNIKHIDKYDDFTLGDSNTNITGLSVDYDDKLYLTLSGGNYPNGGLYYINEDYSVHEVVLVDDVIQEPPISLRKSVNGTFVTEYDSSAVSLKIYDYTEVLNLNSDGYLNYSDNRVSTSWVSGKVKNEIEKLPLLDSGMYSPTASNTTNINNIEFLTGVYTRIGQICTVHISLQVTASASNSLTAFQIGLPFKASDRTVNIGSGALVDVLGDVGPISAQLDDQMASILFKSISQNTATANVTLVYEVL